MYLYRAIDSVGDTVELSLNENRDLSAAKRFFRQALTRHGQPDRMIIDGSHTNHAAICLCDAETRLRDRSRRSLKPIRIRQSQYLPDREGSPAHQVPDPSMLGFRSVATATTILSRIEMIQMMRRQQARYAYNPNPSIAEQFEILAAL
nr:DDE-type integrase/transposase/recombinase [Mesorhizobium sangaii]